MKRGVMLFFLFILICSFATAGPLDDIFSLLQFTGNAVAECKDSDGGYDLSKASEYANYGAYGKEVCLNDNQVLEAVCNNNDLVKYTVSCPERTKCENGACIELDFTSKLCTDTDGFNLYTQGEYYVAGGKNKEICDDHNSLYEYSCVGNILKKELMDCPGGFACKDGACIKVECSDSDGKNVEVTGKYRVGDLDKGETCDSELTVLEYFCDEGVLKRELLDCPSGMKCVAGSCKRQEEIPQVCDSIEAKVKLGESVVFHNVKLTVNSILENGVKVLIAEQDWFLSLGQTVEVSGLRIGLMELSPEAAAFKLQAFKCEEEKRDEISELRKQVEQLKAENVRLKKECVKQPEPKPVEPQDCRTLCVKEFRERNARCQEGEFVTPCLQESRTTYLTCLGKCGSSTTEKRGLFSSLFG